MLGWLARLDNKHTRFLFGLSIAVFASLELAYLAWGFKNVPLPPSYNAACIYLAVLSATTVLCVTPIAFLNYIVRQWVKYQVLCECLWVGFLIVFHTVGTVLAIIFQARLGCGGLFANPDVKCQNNSLFIILGFIILTMGIFLLGNVFVVIQYLRRLSSKSTWTILFTETRRLAMVPEREPSAKHRPYRFPTRSNSYHDTESLQTGQSIDVFGKSASEMLATSKYISNPSAQPPHLRSPNSEQIPLYVHLEVNFPQDASQKCVDSLSPVRKTHDLPRPPPRILAKRYYERRHAKAYAQ